MLTATSPARVSAPALVGATRGRGAARTGRQRPLRIIVPFGPGGGSDIVRRIVGQIVA